MRKDFTQPFIKASHTTAHLLIETEDGDFLQLTERDELDAFYARTLSIELDDAKDRTLQMVELLHRSGFELLKYRELFRESFVDYSYLDDTPGTVSTVACIHVTAERNDLPFPARPNESVHFLPLDQFLSNLRATGMPRGMVETGAAFLLSERAQP
jgi:hypothetical protein